jgi:hypothetical protein
MLRCPGVLLLVILLYGAGCGGQGEQYDVVPVRGVVTCQGKPVANATINFTPIAEEGRATGRPGRVALGLTDEAGRFQLTTYENGDGAIIGRHTVSVGLNMEEDATVNPNRAFPCRDSTIEFTVSPDMGEVEITF